MRRLRDEARLLAQLRHPGIVRLYSCLHLDAGPGLLMELVDGPNLADVLRLGGRLPTTAALELVARVAEALDYAWTLPGKDGQPLNLLHRDIKPANIAVTRHGEVKLLDFGIAWGAFEARETRSGPEPRGTGTYMAPERHRGQDAPTVDVYGLGLVLANMLLGVEHPELPKGEDVQSAFTAALATELLRALGSKRREGELITSLVLSCVEWAPDARPSPRDVADLARALAAELAGTDLMTWAARKVPELHARSTALAQAGADAVGVVLSERAHLRQARVIEEEPDTGIAWLSDPFVQPAQVGPPGVRLAVGTPPETPITPLPPSAARACGAGELAGRVAPAGALGPGRSGRRGAAVPRRLQRAVDGLGQTSRARGAGPDDVRAGEPPPSRRAPPSRSSRRHPSSWRPRRPQSRASPPLRLARGHARFSL